MDPSIPANSIGNFQIGVSQIGTLPFDYSPTIISQYAQSPVINALIADFAAWLDPTQNIDSFFDLIWNVDTAQGYGLDVWGRIVGVSRVIQVTTATYFGFNQQAPTVGAFGPNNTSPFYSGQSNSSSYALSDSAFRTLILAKALANICDGSIPMINQLLLNLFPARGNCYVTSGGNLTMTYTFKFPLSLVELAIVQNSGVLPTPCGVSSSIVVAP